MGSLLKAICKALESLSVARVLSLNYVAEHYQEWNERGLKESPGGMIAPVSSATDVIFRTALEVVPGLPVEIKIHNV